ncbi:MAG TPA: VOC family protein [Planctomycetota bacterium]|nr:VOC family protein [Planctomycetota bacterium]
MATAKKIPDGFHTVTAYLIVRDIPKALDFYTRALGAKELFRMTGPDGKAVTHAEIRIGDSTVMLGAEGGPMNAKSPLALGGTAASIYLYLEDVDSAFEKATRAGGRVAMPVADMFWGDRYGKILDPFGHEWGLATHKEDLTPDQIGARAKEFFSALAK